MRHWLISKVLGLLLCLKVSPGLVSRGAILPPASLGADSELAVAKDIVEQAIKNLPTYEQNGRAEYEGPELAAVSIDIKACETAATDEDFLIDVEQLKQDAAQFDSRDTWLSKVEMI
jgi:hypothetical protein